MPLFADSRIRTTGAECCAACRGTGYVLVPYEEDLSFTDLTGGNDSNYLIASYRKPNKR